MSSGAVARHWRASEAAATSALRAVACASFSSRNLASGRYTSPRISITRGTPPTTDAFSSRGIALTVMTFAALGAALAEPSANRTADIKRVGAFRDRLADGLTGAIEECVETVPRTRRAAGICQLLISGIETEALLVLLDRYDVMASAAASCASGAMEPSHVLAGMGVERTAAAGSLRLSLGWCSQEREIERAIEAIPPCVEQLG